MDVTKVTDEEFNLDPRGAKAAAASGPVFITDRGRTAHVLLAIEDYDRLTTINMSRLKRSNSRRSSDGRRLFASVSGEPRPLAERIERAIILCAYIVLRHGVVYAPIMERLERELEEVRRNDPAEKAKRILTKYGFKGHNKCWPATDAGDTRQSKSRAANTLRIGTSAQSDDTDITEVNSIDPRSVDPSAGRRKRKPAAAAMPAAHRPHPNRQ